MFVGTASFFMEGDSMEPVILRVRGPAPMRTDMAQEKRISCIKKTDRQGAHERIQAVGGRVKKSVSGA